MREAGGYVTEIDGPGRPESGASILAANDALHQPLMRLLAGRERAAAPRGPRPGNPGGLFAPRAMGYCPPQMRTVPRVTVRGRRAGRHAESGWRWPARSGASSPPLRLAAGAAKAEPARPALKPPAPNALIGIWRPWPSREPSAAEPLASIAFQPTGMELSEPANGIWRRWRRRCAHGLPRAWP